MAITWTPLDPTVKYWSPSSTGWQDYDIYTNQGVPKGAIALIVCENGNDAADVVLGIRAYNSLKDQLIKIKRSIELDNPELQSYIPEVQRMVLAGNNIANAIEIVDGGYPHFLKEKCISCLCCIEVCPHQAIKSKQRGFFGLFHSY